MKGKKEKRIEHLLVIRLSAMGDVAMTAPVIRALREAKPEMRITVLTRRFFRPFFRDIDNIGFLDFDPKKYKGVGGLLRLVGDIRGLGVDAVADLHDVLRTKMVRSVLFLGGYRISVIDKGREDKRQLTRRVQKQFRQLTHTVERYRKAISRLGIRFTVPLDATLEKTTRSMPETITALAGVKHGKWVGIAPFAKHKGKIYPIPLTVKLIEMLAWRYERVFIFGGGDHEKSFADALERRHEQIVSVVGRVSLSEEMDVISNLDAMVTMDSSSMHMASLVGTPVVSVWGATHPYAGFYGIWQDPDNAVQLEMACRPCSVYGNKECIFGHYKCMADIAPETIVGKVESVVGRSAPRPARGVKKDTVAKIPEPAGPGAGAKTNVTPRKSKSTGPGACKPAGANGTAGKNSGRAKAANAHDTKGTAVKVSGTGGKKGGRSKPATAATHASAVSEAGE